ncbi:MAG: trypsin-like peptidase domain-containing protein [Oscillospiraceae bacterium]|nr:trypsin-like peptidase domain-containing protein [Oscillospiraceae bacterium]
MRKIFKALSALMAAAVVAAALPVTASAASVNDAKEGVVYIESTFSARSGDEFVFLDSGGYRYLYAGETVYVRGSGFAIGEQGKPVQYIVTNAHVVLDQTAEALNTIDTSGSVTYNSKRATEVTVCFSYGTNDFMRAQIVELDEKRDICVLKLPEATNKRKPLVICKSSEINMDDDFAALGFPAVSDSLMDSSSFTYDVSDITVTRGGIARQSTDERGRHVYQIDIDISGGNSGGPLVNSKGEVVGINTFSITDYSGSSKNYAVVIDELLAMINRDVVSYTLSTEVSGAGILIIVIIIAAVAAAAVVVVIIIMSKKKAAQQPVPENAAAYQSPAAPPPPAAKYGVITGTKGVMNGQTFPISGSILIGRNAQKCNVVYPIDTQGISAVHCQIRETPNGYEIIDRGSSNGTFLGSGQRLAPDVPTPLPNGTFFYLGSAEQLFQIKY